jgi:hypothetical protein
MRCDGGGAVPIAAPGYWWLMRLNLLCAGTVLLIGCSLDEPTTSEDQSDVTAAATFEVHGTGMLFGHTTTGIVKEPIDLSANLFASYSRAPGGALVQELGAGTADGTFEVPVQAGARSWDLETDVVFGSPYLAIGNARHPDVDQHVLGRLDGVAPTTETDLTFDVTGLDAWADGDTTELLVANNGDIVYSPETEFAAPPADGDTAIAGQSIDWSAQFPPTVLIDASQGDIASLEQLIVRSSGTESYQALDRYGTASRFTQTDGAPSMADIAMSHVAQTTRPLHWRGAAFEAMRSEVGAGATDVPGGAQVFVDALPDAARFGFYTNAPDLAIYTPSVPTSNLDLTLRYGNPYHWDEFYSLNYLFAVPVQLGSAAPASVFVGYVANLDVGRVAGGVIAPEISPVRDVHIGRGDSPTVTWSPPAIGCATEYFIQLEQLSASDGQTAANVVASFVTTDRSLQIPSDFITSGSSYVLAITAINFGDVDRTVSLFGDGLPIEQAIMVTPAFTP